MKARYSRCKGIKWVADIEIVTRFNGGRGGYSVHVEISPLDHKQRELDNSEQECWERGRYGTFIPGWHNEIEAIVLFDRYCRRLEKGGWELDKD